MDWRNQPAWKRNWKDVAPDAPFRASIPNDAGWPSDRVHPDTVDAFMHGGRRDLMAFEFVETRDLVVDSLADFGAVAEPDGAVSAVNGKGYVAPAVTRDELPSQALANETMVAAKARLDVAEDAISLNIGRDFDAMVEAGDIAGAIALRNAIVGGSLFKATSIDTLRSCGKWDPRDLAIDRVAPSRLTSVQAAVNLEFQVASREARAAGDVMGLLANVALSPLLEVEDIDGAQAYADGMAPCIQKAFALDRVRHARKQVEAGPKP